MSLTTVIKSKSMAVICGMVFVSQAIIFVIVGRLLSMESARVSAMIDVEEKMHYCVSTGKPFMFEGGRLGVIIDTKTFKNGKTIAYRVMSFVLPEDVEMRWYPASPTETIRRPAALKTLKKKKRVKLRSSITTPLINSRPTESQP